ncbi:MAG TPA: HAD-IA family hydrolase [Syntrophales bacterium]|jgi:phosphoglycolate phosphatase|nr:HAD-IA family hydrolase [Syntrophales bacterium]HON23018.1 HAD-IA family hydrolase [Syntrophales bacterium]HOU77094.1 HAD-IA family hydrolase [Syntrophales bacterium]HPC32774.1 HAD-IA family hydrolase [Syntrophales bacterium]HQG33622.1 HAD-IA family hydrolase [Syntrophales bacterium]
MIKIDLFIFDLDGTLADTGSDIVAAVNYTLGTLGLSKLDDKKILGYVGDGVQELIKRSLGPDHRDAVTEALLLFRAYYREHMLDKTALYPGVQECLAHFTGKRKVVISNKKHEFTVAIVQALGIAGYFDDIVGGDFWPYMKPDARLAEYYLQKYEITRDKAVIVGDGHNDILLAKNAGIVGCAFLNGLVERERLLALKPDITCENLAELKDIFC